MQREHSWLLKLIVWGGVIGFFLMLVSMLFFRSSKQEIIVEEILREEPPIEAYTERVIGASVEARDIVARTYGQGEEHILFVGGIHGGYEWNTVLLAYEAMDFFEENPDAIPENTQVTIIPNLNPDAVYKLVHKEGRFTEMDVTVSSVDASSTRFNTRDVDLNRNFDCKWAPESTWRGNPVSAGDAPFSEPEAKALRDFVVETPPDAVVFWHSAAGNVYASECEEGILPKTLEIMEAYADAAGYGKVEVFDAYPITGDAEGWLASVGIPAVTVELTSHDEVEWEENLAGMISILNL